MFEFFFKYPRAVFSDSDFIFASGWPLGVLVAAVAVFAVAVAVMLARRPGNLGWGKLATLGLLQCLMVAVVMVVLWQPALVSERLLRGENAVAIMLDTSGSMTFSDGGEIGRASCRERV